MCGYCVEQVTILKYIHGTALSSAPLKIPDSSRVSFLQDVMDINSALTSDFRPTAGIPIGARTIVCRGISILSKYGFASNAYQALLKNPVFQEAIKTFTESSVTLNDLSHDPRHTLSSFEWIHDRETFFEPDCFETHLATIKVENATNIIREYINDFLEGPDVCRSNSGIDISGSPEETNYQQRLHSINARFPSLWLALHRLFHLDFGMPWLWMLVVNCPNATPFFESDELWIQRIATLAAYDHMGMVPFLNGLTSVRSFLFQYLALNRQISQQDHDLLHEATIQLPTGDHTDGAFSLRLWLDHGDLQLDG